MVDNLYILVNKKIFKIVVSFLVLIVIVGLYIKYKYILNYDNGDKIIIAIVGDSTTGGFGANPSFNKWKDGHAYGCVNQPRHGENWQKFLLNASKIPNPSYINTTGFPTVDQQSNVNIPSATRLLRTAVSSKNNNSKIYNYGGSGWTANDHIQYYSVAKLSKLQQKPNIVFFNLGINSAKNNKSQDKELRILLQQAISNGILPILVKPNNIGVADSPTGIWRADACPDNWYLLASWQSYRDNIEKIGKDYNITVIDLGADNTLGDVKLLYDSFHPSNLGYLAIFKIYNHWLQTHIFIKKDNGYIVVDNDIASTVTALYIYGKSLALSYILKLQNVNSNTTVIN